MIEPPLETRPLDRCLACFNRDLRALAMRYDHRGSFPVARCPVCDVRFLSIQPTRAALTELYGPAYFEKDFRCGRSDSGYFAEDAFRAENAALLDAFERLAPRGALLEIGCAGGWLLKHAETRGWSTRGVELSAEAVARARALGLEVFQGEVADARLPERAFDLVYMGDVLEHVPDCRAVLTEVARVLKPGGHLYLRGPITTNSLARRLALAGFGLLGRTIVLREPPYHLWEFTPRSLRRLTRAVGLELLKMTESKIPPGRTHGEKSLLQKLMMGAVDGVNLPITRAFNAFGDRVVLIARKPVSPGRAAAA